MNNEFENSTNELNSNSLGSFSLENPVGETPGFENNMQSGVVNPMPAVSEPAQSVVEPMPAASEPVQSAVEPMPVASEPVQSAVEPMPAASEGVLQPIPGTEELTQETVVSGGNLNSDPTDPNTFMKQDIDTNIGLVPPTEQQPEKKPKKKMNKTAFLLLVIVLMLLVAFGVYYFLVVSKSKSKNKYTVEFKNVTLELGSAIPSDISNFITVKKGDISNCLLSQDTQIDTSKEGEYEYSVICGEDTITGGKVKVVDNSAPVAYLNTLFKKKDSELSVNDFVKDCSDSSSCLIEYADQSAADLIKTVGGPYKVDISVKDSKENSAIYSTNLYVLDTDIKIYKQCSSPEEVMPETNVKKVVQDILPFGYVNANLEYLGVSVRNFKYTFSNQDEYNNTVKNKPSSITYDNHTGVATYFDDSFTMVITEDLSMDQLKTENEKFSKEFVEVTKYYSEKSYMCNNEPYTPAITINK